MDTTLKQQDRIITYDMPLTINPLQLKTKEVETLLSLPAGRGLTHRKSFADLSPCPQPLKSIKSCQRIKLNHPHEADNSQPSHSPAESRALDRSSRGQGHRHRMITRLVHQGGGVAIKPGRGHQQLPGAGCRQLLITIAIAIDQQTPHQWIIICIEAGKDMMFYMVREIEVQGIHPARHLQGQRIEKRIVNFAQWRQKVVGEDVGHGPCIAEPERQQIAEQQRRRLQADRQHHRPMAQGDQGQFQQNASTLQRAHREPGRRSRAAAAFPLQH